MNEEICKKCFNLVEECECEQKNFITKGNKRKYKDDYVDGFKPFKKIKKKKRFIDY